MKDPNELDFKEVRFFETTYEEISRFVKLHTGRDLGNSSEYAIDYRFEIKPRVSKATQKEFDLFCKGELGEDAVESLGDILTVLCKQKKLPAGDYRITNFQRYEGLVE